MAVRLLKCYGEDCLKNNLKYPKEQLVEVGGKRFCQKCLIEHQKQKAERQKLYNYICEVFEIPNVTGHMMKQIKTFKEQYGISYREQLLTVNYVVERTDLNLDIKYGVAFIGTYHQTMLTELDEMIEQQEKLRDYKQDDVNVICLDNKQQEEKVNDFVNEIDMKDLF